MTSFFVDTSFSPLLVCLVAAVGLTSPASGWWFPHNGIPLAQRRLGSVYQRG